VLDNFIDTHGLRPALGEQIAFVGRLSHEKGPDRFLRLARRFPRTIFHCYGTGPMAAELKTQAPGNLRFHGLQTDMSCVWPDIGLLIMPSRYEGLPMAALEAMGRGIPVIAHDVGDLSRVIDHGSNGWLAPQGNIEGLAAGLEQWLSMGRDEQKPIRMAAADKIEHCFSARAVIPEVLGIYWQIAKPAST
jgi:glycosyltransferase involved in cell wall biosynthesis